MPVKPTYRTSDLAEIIFLMCHSVPLLIAERDGERVEFCFDDSNDLCAALIRDFVLGRDQASISRVLQERQRALRIINMT